MAHSANLRCAILSCFALSAAAQCSLAPSPAVAAPASGPAQSIYTMERTPVYHAFIFANDEYDVLPDIPSAAKDFALMRDFFQRSGYRMWEIGGNGRFHSVQEFYAFMAKAREEIEPGDIVVLYYSGHGFHYGNQNWLVPLDYPSGPVHAQMLFKTAVGLNDVINGLAEKRPDYVVPILDSCRTTVQFPMAGGTAGGAAEVRDPLLTGFNFLGPSLLAWLIGVPTQTGGQAIGTSSPNEPSLYTGVLSKAFEAHSKLNEVQRALKSAVQDLINAGIVTSVDIAPRFIANDLDFDFSSQKDPATAERQAREWMTVLREPSKKLVSSYLIRNPGSSYSTAAWQFIDDHAADPIDNSGFSATDAEKVDIAFVEGAANGKLIAIATPGFTAKFPRNALGQEPTRLETMADSIVYADNVAEIGEVLAQRYATKGSKLKFDVSVLQDAGSLKGDRELLARAAPSSSAEVLAKFDKSTSYKIAETFFEADNNTLFARVQTGIAGEPVSEGSWISFDYGDAKAPEYNVLNRALREVYISAESLTGVSSESTIAGVTAEVRGASNDILWVSIAVDYTSLDLVPLRRRLEAAQDDDTRAEIAAEIERAARIDQRAFADANLRSNDARQQLISAGVDGKRISIVSDSAAKLGSGVRLRYFGSR